MAGLASHWRACSTFPSTVGAGLRIPLRSVDWMALAVWFCRSRNLFWISRANDIAWGLLPCDIQRDTIFCFKTVQNEGINHKTQLYLYNIYYIILWISKEICTKKLMISQLEWNMGRGVSQFLERAKKVIFEPFLNASFHGSIDVQCNIFVLKSISINISTHVYQVSLWFFNVFLDRRKQTHIQTEMAGCTLPHSSWLEYYIIFVLELCTPCNIYFWGLIMRKCGLKWKVMDEWQASLLFAICTNNWFGMRISRLSLIGKKKKINFNQWFVFISKLE